jgi:hypothetical protein
MKLYICKVEVKKTKKLAYIVAALLIVGSLATIGVGKEAGEQNEGLPLIAHKTLKAINKPIIQTNLAGNVLISDNTGDDLHPRIMEDGAKNIVVLYEQELDLFSKQVPMVWSADGGETWTVQFLFDSIEFTEGSGILQHPIMVHSKELDVLYFSMIDPLAEVYNNEMGFIQGDLSTAEEASWYGISGSGAENYNFCTAATTGNFFISLNTEDGYGFEQLFGLFYCLYPDFETPPTMGGFYYDGNSEHESAPGAWLEMDTNANRILAVCETNDQITIKSTPNDEAMLTNGEQQNGMDKYADIEQWPGEYLTTGSDPDVSGDGDHLIVAFEQGGDVKAKFGTCAAGTYEPGFDLQDVTIATGASNPAVYMQGSNVYCVYVKDGNLFLTISEDYGATWSEPEQKNDEDGTVSAEKNTADIHPSGIVFTDTRNGNKDVYFAPLEAVAIPEVVIESISGGIGVSATLKNIGEAAAENFAWSIVSEGLVFLGGEKSGQATLEPGDEITVSTGLMLGLGDIEITVTADAAKQTASAKLLLFFVTGL